MNIRQKVRLATAATLVTIGVIALMIWNAYAEVVQANQQRLQLVSIGRALTDLRQITFEYRLYGHERARQQWGSVLDRLQRLLDGYSTRDPELRARVDSMREGLHKARVSFADLTGQGREAADPPADATGRRDFEDRIFAALLLDQQENFEDVRRLSDAASARIAVAQERVVKVTALGLLVIAVATIGTALLTHREVLAPIGRLQAVTGEIAAGRFDIQRKPQPNDEVGELTLNFYAMADRLQASFADAESRNRDLAALNRELQAFSYSVSHDLRSPLRSMDGLALIVLEDYGDRLDDQGRDLLARIRAASQRMGKLIDDLLGLSLVSRAELATRDLDFTALVREVADNIERGDGAPVEWQVEDGMTLRADRALLVIAMQNLLQNAAKFAGKRAHPVVRIGRVPGREGTFFVADNGVGFDMQHAKRLFTPFERLHRQSDYPGTGIGLAIVQRIIQRHGGTITAESKVGDGATFTFSMKDGA